jgi:putative selenate reductase molybdopterin-binding subunit
MKIKFTFNGTPRHIDARPGENGQRLLQRMGIPSVRNSDDGTGVTGSDAVLFDNKIVNAGLLVAAQIDGHDIKTVESLSDGQTMSAVQSSMVDAGVVQSGYNAPAAALILTDLLNRIPEPTEADIRDALSGFYTRDNGFQQFFKAVEIARQRRQDPAYTTGVADEFREDLRDVGRAQAGHG